MFVKPVSYYFFPGQIIHVEGGYFSFWFIIWFPKASSLLKQKNPPHINDRLTERYTLSVCTFFKDMNNIHDFFTCEKNNYFFEKNFKKLDLDKL